jgi:hypothetical protein
MSTTWHFPIFVAVSFAAFIGMLRFVLRKRPAAPSWTTLIWVALVVVVAGMLFAKTGTRYGLPVWLYYGVPAALTWVLPPLVFRMQRREMLTYLVLAFVLAPAIHVIFSFFLGWKEYLPFIPVPSFAELVRR